MTRASIYPPQASAQCEVTYAIKRGLLRPEPCKHCGTESKTEAHHHNYFKPLDVVWLCRKCHMGEHKRLRIAGLIIPGSNEDPRAGEQRARASSPSETRVVT